MKTRVWTKSIKKKKKLLQLAHMVYYGREYEVENKSKKEPGNRLKPQTMAVRSTLKQSEKNA